MLGEAENTSYTNPGRHSAEVVQASSLSESAEIQAASANCWFHLIFNTTGTAVLSPGSHEEGLPCSRKWRANRTSCPLYHQHVPHHLLCVRRTDVSTRQSGTVQDTRPLGRGTKSGRLRPLNVTTHLQATKSMAQPPHQMLAGPAGRHWFTK